MKTFANNFGGCVFATDGVGSEIGVAMSGPFSSSCRFYEQVKPIEEKILSLLEKINKEDANSETMEILASCLIESINKRNITIKSLH